MVIINQATLVQNKECIKVFFYHEMNCSVPMYNTDYVYVYVCGAIYVWI